MASERQAINGVDANASEAELAELREHVEATSPLVDNITSEVPPETELVVERSR